LERKNQSWFEDLSKNVFGKYGGLCDLDDEEFTNKECKLRTTKISSTEEMDDVYDERDSAIRPHAHSAPCDG